MPLITENSEIIVRNTGSLSKLLINIRFRKNEVERYYFPDSVLSFCSPSPSPLGPGTVLALL